MNTLCTMRMISLHKRPVSSIGDELFGEAQSTPQPYMYCSWYRYTEMYRKT